MGHRAENIFDVVETGSVEELRALILAGGKVDAKGNEKETPLHQAVDFARVDMARVLLAHGAPVNAQDSFGSTPLWRCAERPELGIAMAALLIECGADVNRSSLYDGAPLHWSANCNHVELIELLVKSGAQINARDQKGWTPLHLAAFEGNADAVARLLSLGADPHSKTDDGQTALKLATTAEIRKLLPVDPAFEAKVREIDAIFANLTELGWFKHIPTAEVDDVRGRFRDAYLVEPSLLAPYEEQVLRGIDRRSCAADAEDLAEGDVHMVLLLLKDALAREGVVFSEVVSDVTDDGYDLIVDGTRHVLFDNPAYDWQDALERTPGLVNQLLEDAGSTERLYSLGSGNDASVLLLSPALAAYVKTLDVSPPLNESNRATRRG